MDMQRNGSEVVGERLADEQLDQASGGIWWLFFPVAVDQTFGDSMRKLSDAMGGSTQVMAGPDGQGDYRVGSSSSLPGFGS